jgi:hypothetical protein
MQDGKKQPEDFDPDSYLGSADKKYLKVVGFVVLALALLVWADTATYGEPGEMVYADAFLKIGLLAAGIGGFAFWLRKK